MIIEFRKVPKIPSVFKDELLSVKIEGTFCKISQRLIKIDAITDGMVKIDCSICGESFDKKLEEKSAFLLSDGDYKSDNKSLDIVVVEIDNHKIDFQDLIKSEIETFKSDYHICDNCK